jgi:ribokinase
MSVCVLGSVNLDLVLRVKRFPQPGETLTALSRTEFPGGKGANQAVAAARLGVPTRLIGAVGQDAAGDWMLDQLAAFGVDLAGVARLAGQPTGQALILVSDAGENVIVVVGGANLALQSHDLAPNAFDDANILLVQMETPVAINVAGLTAAKARGARTVVNAAPASDAGRALFALADILIVNQSELAYYAGAALEPDGGRAVALARRLIDGAGQWVIVTLGAAGVLAVSADEAFETPGRPASVVDTTGAGDCFCGALAVALDEGQTLREALVFANVAASLSVGKAGAAGSMPSREAVEAALAADRQPAPAERR